MAALQPEVYLLATHDLGDDSPTVVTRLVVEVFEVVSADCC